MSLLGHCPTCGQHHLAESDTEELHGLLAECERLEREVLGENERLRLQLAGAIDRIAELERALLAAGTTLRKAGLTICADAADAVRCPTPKRGQ